MSTLPVEGASVAGGVSTGAVIKVAAWFAVTVVAAGAGVAAVAGVATGIAVAAVIGVAVGIAVAKVAVPGVVAATFAKPVFLQVPPL